MRPDTAWGVSDERLPYLSEEEQEDTFLEVVPDFVAEIRLASDHLSKVKLKMEETWMANGVRLSWLIAPYEERVYIYRQGQETEVIQGFPAKNSEVKTGYRGWSCRSKS